MGNKTSRRARAIEGPQTTEKVKHRRQNHVARELLEEHVPDRIPTDDEMLLALAAQQSQVTGNLKKADLISILIRLNPTRNNALISQYTTDDLIVFIRHELYTVPLQAQQTPTSTKLEIEDVTE